MYLELGNSNSIYALNYLEIAVRAFYQSLVDAHLVYPLIVVLILSAIITIALHWIIRYQNEVKQDRLKAIATQQLSRRMNAEIAQRRSQQRSRLQQERKMQRNL